MDLDRQHYSGTAFVFSPFEKGKPFSLFFGRALVNGEQLQRNIKNTTVPNIGYQIPMALTTLDTASC